MYVAKEYLVRPHLQSVEDPWEMAVYNASSSRNKVANSPVGKCSKLSFPPPPKVCFIQVRPKQEGGKNPTWFPIIVKVEDGCRLPGCVPSTKSRASAHRK